jgi:CRISPR-associated exonuclease Cas4
MLDNDQVLFTITDLKQFIYCPRIFYYQVCLPRIRPVTYKMEAGIAAHRDEPARSARRKLIEEDDLEQPVERAYHVPVRSDRLGLTGQLDEVARVGDRWIPIDYKLAKKAGEHFRVQLTAYAMLLEDQYQVSIASGWLYLISARSRVEVRFTAALRQKVLDALDTMRAITASEIMPAPTEWRPRCADCEFRRFCNDV